MPNKDPLGIYARDRLDWSLESAMLGAAYLAPSTQSPRIGLANQGSQGLPLALYGVCAKGSAAMVDLNLSLSASPDPAATVAANNLLLQSLIPSQGAIDGYPTVAYISPASTTPAGIAFRTDGTRWFSFARFPLMLIPPGSAANVVFDIFGAGAAAIQTGFSVAFMWSYYRQNIPPRTTL